MKLVEDKPREGMPRIVHPTLAELSVALTDVAHGLNHLLDCAHRLEVLVLKNPDPDLAALHSEVERVKDAAHDAFMHHIQAMLDEARRIAQEAEEINDGARLP